MRMTSFLLSNCHQDRTNNKQPPLKVESFGGSKGWYFTCVFEIWSVRICFLPIFNFADSIISEKLEFCLSTKFLQKSLNSYPDLTLMNWCCCCVLISPHRFRCKGRFLWWTGVEGGKMESKEESFVLLPFFRKCSQFWSLSRIIICG